MYATLAYQLLDRNDVDQTVSTISMVTVTVYIACVLNY